MHTEPHTGEVRHHKPKHLAEKFEGMIGIIMVAAIIIALTGGYFLMKRGESYQRKE